jgi:hypothetical protein
LPHPDIVEHFSRVRSLYFIHLPELLRRMAPTLVSDVMLEQSWTQEARGLSEILEAEDLLFHQVWYNRRWGLRIRVQDGRIKIVESETYPHPPGRRETIQRDVWKGALRAARRTEQRYGKKNLDPWDDAEGPSAAIRSRQGSRWRGESQLRGAGGILRP